MYRKWKSMAALGMAVLIGCSMPMGTMLAAEENPEAVQEVEVDSASDTDAASDDETVLEDKGNDGDEIDADDENAVDEVDADDENAVDAVDADDEIADEEGIADNDGNAGIAVMSVADAEEGDVAVHENTAAPVINITLNGENCKVDGLGGKIDYIYVNNLDRQFEYSASQGDQDILIYYYLDKFDDITDNAKDEEQMASLWPDGPSSPMIYKLSLEKKYVLYVKAVGKDGQIAYARSCGVVVDSTAPEIVGLNEGGTYQEGTVFQIKDANLASVTINNQSVAISPDGNYQVVANGTSCVIKAVDKAKHETTCSITVTARDLSANGVISESGLYSLQAGTPYKLGAGKWQVDSDKSVYAGGNTFYVKEARDYRFTKR